MALTHGHVEDAQGFDEIRVFGADRFALAGREVGRFEESPIFDIVSVPGEVPDAVEIPTIDELRHVMSQAPGPTALQNGRVKIRYAELDEERR